MASITAPARAELIALYTSMFNAAPGANNLGDMVSIIESGKQLLDVANFLAAKPDFGTVYPAYLTADEFATKLAANLLGSEVSADDTTWAINWVKTQLQAQGGLSGVAKVITMAVQALESTTSADFLNAQTMLNNKIDAATYYSITQGLSSTSLATLQSVIAGVSSSAASVTAAHAVVDNLYGDAHAQTYTLTAAVDTITGGIGNDTFIANDSTNAVPTLTSLDAIDGGAGNNTLTAVITGGISLAPVATVKNIQTINLLSGAAVATDLTTFTTGVTQLTVTSAGDGVVAVTPASTLTAAATTAISNTTTVLGNDTITIKGGSTVTSTDVGGTTGTVTIGGAGAAAPAGAVTVVHTGTGLVQVTGGTTQDITAAGAVTLSKASGDVTVTDSADGAIQIDNGANVTVTATTAGSSSIVVGNSGSATPAVGTPTGNVTVTQNLNGTGGSLVGGGITVTGGVVDAVTVKATADTVGNTTTIGAINVLGTAATTTVSVTQTPATAAAAAATTATAAVKEVDSVTFAALAANTSTTVNGLTFTAGAAGTTAAQTAAAFANLANGAVHGSSPLGAYSGTFNTAGWTSGAVSGTGSNVVQFTQVTAATGTATLASTIAPVSVTAGVAAAGVTSAGVAAIVDGTVQVSDVNYGAGTNTITSATLDGYGASSYVASDALATLSLANSAQAFSAYNNTATTLSLTLNKVTGTVNLDAAGSAKYTTLNIHTATANSASVVTAAAVKTLVVDGTKAVTLSAGSTLTALTTVAVHGSAGLTLDASGANVTDVNASDTSGAVTVTALAAAATYEGGTGVDTVTLTSTAPAKAISLGGGNDSLTLAAATTTVSAILDGGDGSDTIKMTLATEQLLEGVTGIKTLITNFETLDVSAISSTATIDLSKLGFSGLTSEGVTGGGSVLTVSNFGNDATLTVNANTTGTGYTLTNAAFAAGTADSVHVTLGAAVTLAGTVTAADVETVGITASNTAAATIALTATSATSITVGGTGKLTLTPTGDTAVTAFDAHSNSGGVTYVSVSTAAETITGGSGDDHLSASLAGSGTTTVTIIGGAGNDTITSNHGLDILTGGAGNDTFVISTPANLNSYATITDASAGDRIQFANGPGTGIETFTAAKISLAATAVFQDYVNEAVNAGGANGANGAISWFQYSGDTYVVESRHDATSPHDFQNGGDVIVKLSGAIDLSTATLSTTDNSIMLH